MNPAKKSKPARYWLGKHLSDKTKEKLHLRFVGRAPWNTGKQHSEETKRKISESRKGQLISEETKKKMHDAAKERIKTHPLPIGESSPKWKGGRKAQKFRRRQLGFVCLNEPFEGAVAHHIDRINVIFVPSELHKRIGHSQNNPESMERINTKVFCWLLGVKV